MANMGSFKITIDGVDISPKLKPIVQSITIRDEAGSVTDTAQIVLDDADATILFPRPGVSIEIALNDSNGFGVVFRGTVDEPRSSGGRSSGRLLSISAKGMDALSGIKTARQRHWDDTTIGDALMAAGRTAGVAVSVDPSLASIQRDYLAQNGESFLAFGQRLAREVGGTFKVAGDRAVLAKRNGGTSVSGLPLAEIRAAWGENLIGWDIAPVIGRNRHRRARVRSYDRSAARWKERTVEIADDVAENEADHLDRFAAADDSAAGDQASANAGEVERGGGGGTINIDANVAARPEAICVLVGARPGIDGRYRITAVEHSYDRGGGTVTALEVGQPHGTAGVDPRKR